MRRVLVTGVSRRLGIGAAIADQLRADGWEVVAAGSTAYDDEMPWGRDTDPLDVVDADLADPDAPAALVLGAGPLDALVIAHALVVESTIETTSVEAFDRHLPSTPAPAGCSSGRSSGS